MNSPQRAHDSLGDVEASPIGDPVAHVTLVTAPACHLCTDAHDALSQRADRGLLTLSVIEVDSPEGEALVSAHRPALFPMVLLNGRLLGCGRLSRGKLDRALGKAA